MLNPNDRLTLLPTPEPSARMYPPRVPPPRYEAAQAAVGWKEPAERPDEAQSRGLHGASERPNITLLDRPATRRSEL